MGPTSEGHDPEFEQLAALCALGVFEGEELARFETHLAECANCRIIEHLDREALRHLPLATPEMEASPGFKSRLMLRAAAEHAELAVDRNGSGLEVAHASDSIRTRGAGGMRRWRFWTVGAVSAVLSVALTIMGVLVFENQTVEVFELDGTAAGSATLQLRRSGFADVLLRDMPDPGPGFVYEVWLTRGEATATPVGIGTAGTTRIELSADVRGGIVAITLEDGFSLTPTQPALKQAQITV